MLISFFGVVQERFSIQNIECNSLSPAKSDPFPSSSKIHKECLMPLPSILVGGTFVVVIITSVVEIMFM